MWFSAWRARVRTSQRHSLPQRSCAAYGSKPIREHRCTECHVAKVGGDGSAVYRPAGRINSPAALLAMVEMCSTELELQLLPEDAAAVAAVLQGDHCYCDPEGSKHDESDGFGPKARRKPQRYP